MEGNPKIETLLKILGYVGIMRRKGMNIKSCCIYNPIQGKLFKWDLIDWNSHDELLNIYKNLYDTEL